MITNQYTSLWQDSALLRQIDQGIEQHRKADVMLQVQDAAGKPLPGASVQVEQTNSAFLFGANIFMLGCYPSAEQNRGYEQAFLDLFNAATVPFYWRDLEPERGNIRFSPDSRPIVRRPPPDSVVAFCQKHGLNMNGHPLIWDFVRWSAPDWLPDDPAQAAPLWEERIRQIAGRYGKQIPRWDVVNEVLTSPARVKEGRSRRMLPNYECLAFAWAQRYLPPDAFLMINETTAVWWHDCDPYVAMIQRLLSEGARIDGIGLQFHLFQNEEMAKCAAGSIYTPQQMLGVMDRVGTLGRPLHISEITLPALANDPAGQETQAQVTASFYRLWFSHPAVHAITWWNLPDGGAAPGEDALASGLITRDFQPKPGYLALQNLIRKTWRTNCTTTADRDGTLRFRGFHGDYRITVRAGGDAYSARLSVPAGQIHSATIQPDLNSNGGSR